MTNLALEPLKLSSDLRELHKLPWRSAGGGGSNCAIHSILPTPLVIWALLDVF